MEDKWQKLEIQKFRWQRTIHQLKLMKILSQQLTLNITISLKVLKVELIFTYIIGNYFAED